MAITKQLEITQAVEGERVNKTVHTSYDFKKELSIQGVTDIFSSITIKQDKTKYIFTMNNKNIFAVDGKVNLISRIQDFYKSKEQTDIQKTEEQVLIRLEGLELQHITTTTKEEADLLKADIARTNALTERTTNIENIKFHIERVITLFEQERDLAKESSRWFSSKYDRKDDNLRKIHKKEIERRIKELHKIKEQVELLANNQNKTYEIERDIDPTDKTKEISNIKEVKMSDINAMDKEMTLKQLYDRIDAIEDEVPDFITSRNDIILEKGDTHPYYEIIIHDKSDAQRISKSLKKINNQYAILNKIKLTDAKRQELSQDLQDLETYLNKVIPNTFNPSEHPFVPTHSEDFYKLVEIDPTLAAFAKLNKKANKTTDGTSDTQITDAAGATTTEAEKGTKANKEEKAGYTESEYESSRDAFEKGGVGGVMKRWIDQTNMKPEQKQFRGGVSNLALIGGMIFVGWKMISSAFKLFTKKGRSEENLGKNLGWLLGPTALIFGSQARSGEGPMSLFTGGALTEKLSSVFGGKKTEEGEKTSQETSDTQLKYKSFPGATALFNGLNYGEMKQFMIQDGDRMKIDPEKYNTLLSMFKTGAKKNVAAAAFLESMGKDDNKNMLDLALTGMGVERDDIQDDTKKESKFNEKAGTAIIRLREVSEYLEDKGYNKINPETIKLVDNYISKGDAAKYNLEELDARGDVFYKDTEVIDKTGLESKITTITGTDLQRKEDLLLAINTFYDQMPNASKKIDITGTRPKITFTTYNQSSILNLEKKELEGFTPKEFDSYTEAFKAANLTNRIKEICKNKEAKSEKPFYLSVGRDITFDNATIFSTDFDTEIMTAGRGGSLTKVSPILETHKQEYCDYLNGITPKIYKEAPTT